jgi:bla regulator protein BlaR1
MNSADLSPFANHLWQSTVFAGVAGLLTLALRKNPARVRHWVWLAASYKFLIPLSLLIALGGHIQWHTGTAMAHSDLSVVMDKMSQPFTAQPVASTLSVVAAPAGSLLPAVLLGFWGCGFIGISCAWLVRWRRIRAAVRAGSPVHLELPVKAMSSPALLEPGVFGVLQPVLMLPEGIFERLMPAQLEAVIAHELCHVRRRDNLVAAIHMFVETVFWFYPLVWWMGKRMLEERERACDEEVLRLGCEASVYAEGILNICKLYVESPPACVAGVTGANLKRRIEAIMINRGVARLNLVRKLVLVAAGTAALAAPIIVGVMDAPAIRAQSEPAKEIAFEVASIKLHAQRTGTFIHRIPTAIPFHISGNRVNEGIVTLQEIVMDAYDVKAFQVSGAPKWAEETGGDHYDIIAKAEGTGSPSVAQVRRMLQTLLADRFQLKLHRETRELPVYELTIGKSGFKLKEIPVVSHPGDAAPAPQPGIDMVAIVGLISRFVDRPVIDKTSLTGRYDFVNLDWGQITEDRGAIFAAIQETYGLRLEPKKAGVEVLVIDQVQRPSEN